MNIELLHSTPLWVCSTAIRKCWASEGKSDTPKALTGIGTPVQGRPNDIRCNVCGHHFCVCGNLKTGDKDKELIHRIGNKNKHSSTLEHLTYSFDIDGISRACLQELARHRMASYSVKSTRYTLKELKEEPWGEEGGDFKNFLVQVPEDNDTGIVALLMCKQKLEEGMSNDKAKYYLPENYKTSLVMTINARSLQNFLELRTSPHALWEIRDLAYGLFDKLPEEHKYLFEDYVVQEGEEV